MTHLLYASPNGMMHIVIFGTFLEIHQMESWCKYNIIVCTTTKTITPPNQWFWLSIMMDSVSLRKATTTINISIERLYIQALLLSCYYCLVSNRILFHSSYSFIISHVFSFIPPQTTNTILLITDLFWTLRPFWPYNVNPMIKFHQYWSFHRENSSKIERDMTFLLFDVETHYF